MPKVKNPLFALLFATLAVHGAGGTVNDVVRYEKQRELHSRTLSYAQPSEGNLSAPQRYGGETPQKGGRCMRIDTITMEKNALIDEKFFSSTVSPYLHRCDTIADIFAILHTLNNRLMQKGWITSRAYLKEQDISDGSLEISLMEGRIESVRSEGVDTSLVFLSPEERVLNLRYLESRIEQLNRLRSLRTVMRLQPGTKDGYSKVLLLGEKTAPPWYADLQINNYGYAPTGRYRIYATLGRENPLGVNDLLKLSLSTTDRHSGGSGLYSVQLDYSLPLGGCTPGVRGSYLNYAQQVEGLSRSYDSDGYSDEFSFYADCRLYHTASSRGEAGFSLTRSESRSYLEGIWLENSSSVLEWLQLYYRQSFTGRAYNAYAMLTYERGLRGPGVFADAGGSVSYEKAALDAALSLSLFEWEKAALAYAFELHAQYGSADMPASRHISIGGPYSVRGFKESGSIAGENGIYIRNELSLKFGSMKSSIEPYAGLDWGAVPHSERSEEGKIAGGALGVRLKYGSLSADTFCSFPLYHSQDTETGSFVGFSISYSF